MGKIQFNQTYKSLVMDKVKKSIYWLTPELLASHFMIKLPHERVLPIIDKHKDTYTVSLYSIGKELNPEAWVLGYGLLEFLILVDVGLIIQEKKWNSWQA